MWSIMRLKFINKRFRSLIFLCISMALCIMFFTTKTSTLSQNSTMNLQNFITVDNSAKAESSNQVKNLPENNCKPKQNILFLKTHKTGSSSVQNIFFRYGDKNNLTFVLPTKVNYFGHPQPFNRRMLDSEPTFSRHTNTLSSSKNNIFTHHARYNYEEMKSIMPVNTIFVTVLRDPVLLIESIFSYYGLKIKFHENSTIQLLENFFSTSSNNSGYHPAFNERILDKFGRNQMSFDLGLDVGQFDNLEMIEKFIKMLDSQFHLVMIIDRMEESLILLQHLLCWTLDDIITFQHNVRNVDVSRNLSIALEQRIRVFNNADELLYKYFCDKLTRQTEAFGKTEMEKQIISLRHATKSMYDKCVEKLVPMKELASSDLVWYSRRVLGFKLRNNTDKNCRDLTTSELLYTELLKEKQGLKNVTSKVYTNRAILKA